MKKLFLHRLIAWLLTLGLLFAASYTLIYKHDWVSALVIVVLADIYSMIILHTIGFTDD